MAAVKMCATCKVAPRAYEYNSYCRECYCALKRRIRAEKNNGTFISRKGLPRLTNEERDISAHKLKDYMKNYRIENKEYLVTQKREARRKARLDGIKEYGGKCTCCGESNEKFLSLEHLKGRQNDELVPMKAAKAWQRLKTLGWPKDNYTILCFNCNMAKGIYGTCPHKLNIGDSNDKTSSTCN